MRLNSLAHYRILGVVDKVIDGGIAASIQSCLLEGGRIDSRPADGCGMGIVRAVCDRDRPQAGATSRRSSARLGWYFLDRANWRALARSAGGTGQMEFGVSPIPAMDACGAVGHCTGSLGENRGRARYASNDQLHHHPGAPSRSRRKGGIQRNALGRSRGGFSTKIHLRTNAEGLPIGSMLTAGGGKGPQFKTNARRGEGLGDWATYQLRRVFRNCRRRCTRKRRQKPAIASMLCTTRSAVRTS